MDNRSKKGGGRRDKKGGGVDKRSVISGAVCESMPKQKLVDIARFLGINVSNETRPKLCKTIELEMKNKKWIN